jgi:hypothetical protein
MSVLRYAALGNKPAREQTAGNSATSVRAWKEWRAMPDVDDWLSEVGLALGVPVEDVLPEPVRLEMLGLTGEIAHHVVRLAVPLTSYLVGVAVGRGASPADALRIVAELVPSTPAADQ